MDDLTEREIEILKLVAVGHTNQEIAKIVNATVHTIKAHITSIMKKINVDNRTRAAYWAFMHDFY